MFWSWKNDAFQGKLEVWHSDSEGIDQLAKELRRGDFLQFSENLRARRWIWNQKKKLRREFLDSPEGAGVKAANAAWISALTALAAVLISVCSLVLSWRTGY